MKTLSLFALALAVGLTVGIPDAEAKRLGGGKPLGMQRQMDVPKAPAAPTAAPAPTAPAAATAAKPAPAAAAPQTSGARSWLGPLAGLAAGLGLAALASHFGFGEELATFMLMLLIAFAVIAAVGFFMRKRALQQPAMAGNTGASWRAGHEEPQVSRFEAPAAQLGAGGTAASAASGRIPADFDVAGFIRNAKVHYIRLQAANDAGNLDDIRAFTTPEMFAELKMDIAERGGAPQETDVVSLEAEVLDVTEEANRYIVSVRFTGQIREEKHGPLAPIDEIWHLVKPRDGSSGWVLAGIQQTH
ncbi:MAG: Tim44-like domain-containing protein [Rhodocyclaceae bacterium]|nr:Tim44-like domain-containing protein [Rhodocyclaceae bacterium]